MIETDVIIIGKGPAGISASLYTQRAKLKTIVFGKDTGALEKAHLIENYYGLGEPVSGKELAQRGVEQAKKLGVEVLEEEVISISFEENGYHLKTTKQEYQAKAVLLATGSARNKPLIKNLESFEGKGVSYCAICDAFFFREKIVGVVGAKEYALSEVEELLPVVGKVLLFTNGEEAPENVPAAVEVIEKKITMVIGEKNVEEIVFEDGTSCEVSGLFIADGTAGSTEFAKKLGVYIENNKIITDANQRAGLPGLYAAGDCTPGPLQIAKAVGEGCEAGLDIIRYIREINQK